eukprot:CAMPEP_0172183734 /NCGR_PEP_ID=MMETSP1050-20130122/19163_1 /TAXON_ID=233186 /ORGANISM="Cryptomonas curvata, Strain CCAP979/52" /LENGTH=166 /DNA_ID=CAMNT_0012857411 /DNA_START=76 /DNA_END=573 /DNA_ORIENTATION=+
MGICEMGFQETMGSLFLSAAAISYFCTRNGTDDYHALVSVTGDHDGKYFKSLPIPTASAIQSYGGLATDTMVAVSNIPLYQEPGSLGEANAANAIEHGAGPDRLGPIFDDPALIRPGDAPGDEPPLHRAAGIFSLGGLFQDRDADLLTGSTSPMACCRCIPGAPAG